MFDKLNETVDKPTVSLDELSTIVAVAKGGTSEQREEAIKIYMKYIRILDRHKNIYMAFMSEVSNLCPDLAMRWGFRERVISDARKMGIS